MFYVNSLEMLITIQHFLHAIHCVHKNANYSLFATLRTIADSIKPFDVSKTETNRRTDKNDAIAVRTMTQVYIFHSISIIYLFLLAYYRCRETSSS